jgi:CIC family chloride channel protein
VLVAGGFLYSTLCWWEYVSIADKNPGEILENTLFSKFKDNTWVLLAFVGLTMMVKVFC